MFLTVSADFIAAAKVLNYVGAINILILFAIVLVIKNGVACAAFAHTLYPQMLFYKHLPPSQLPNPRSYPSNLSIMSQIDS